MNMVSVAENVLAALISAAFLGVLAWLYSWLRNLRLEAQLTNAIDPNGVCMGFDSRTCRGEFTLQIHNYANATIRVRSIVFIADKFHVELRPAHGKPMYQTPLSNEITRPIFKRKHLSKGSLEPDNNPHSMLLPPKTMGIWEVDPETIGTREWIIQDIFMVFEYATVFGNSALIRIKAKETSLRLVKSNFEELAKAVHNKRTPAMFASLKPLPHGAQQGAPGDGPRPAGSARP
jgi:hypothetical protein